MPEFDSKEILKKAKEIVKAREICNNCLGRQFGKIGTGFTNRERGEKIRKSIKSKEPDYCEVCDDMFNGLEEIADKTVDRLKQISFNTFHVGTKMSHEFTLREETLWEAIGIENCEPIKSELNRELGKLLEKKTGKAYDKNPDIVVFLDMEKRDTRVDINPLFVYGKYRKLVRGIPQTKWEKYPETIEDIIAKPFMEKTNGRDHALHGCVSLDTCVFASNGYSIPIKSIKNKDTKLTTFDIKNKQLHISKVLDYFELNPTDIKLKTLRIRTNETDRKLTATEDHEIYTPNGMVAIGKLKKGDKIAILPIKPKKPEKIKSRVIITEDDIKKAIDAYFPKYTKSSEVIAKLKEKKLIPLLTHDERLVVLTRILAFLFGDGNVRCVRNRDISLEFYGETEDLNWIKDDLTTLGFEHSPIRTRKNKSSVVKNYYGNERAIAGKGSSFVSYSRELWYLLVSLGAPVGDKVTSKLKVPSFVKNGDEIIKREFLSALLGCEIDKPRLDKRKHNRKSFNTPRFSMNKIEKKLENGIEFIKNISNLLNEFGIETLPLRLLPYTTRRDGNKSIKIILDISNKFENLIDFYGDIGFRYCKKKEALSRLVFQYLSIKKNVLDKRKDLYDKAVKLKKRGLKLSEIHKSLDSGFVTKKDLWVWLNGAKRENIKVPNSFPNFDYWTKEASDSLADGLVWETIGSIEDVNLEKACDITTNPTHTFFANGFLVSNCGREDIDALCLGWRPFVFEVSKPRNRDIDLKEMEKEINKTGKVEVSELRLSNKQEVRDLKAAKPDKSYRMVVEFENKINEKSLKKLKELIGAISQKTPQRVAHRRANLVRERKLISIEWKLISNKKLEITVRGEAGLYVKELVSGDNGGTKPSVSEILGNQGKVTELDVIKIWI